MAFYIPIHCSKIPNSTEFMKASYPFHVTSLLDLFSHLCHFIGAAPVILVSNDLSP